jgi:hypothetical protein
MAGCKLENCQLKEDVAEIRTTQGALVSGVSEMKTSHDSTQKIVNGMAVEFGKVSQKLDDYMMRGKDEHDALFAKVRGVVKWPHLLMALTAISIIVGITWKFATGG